MGGRSSSRQSSSVTDNRIGAADGSLVATNGADITVIASDQGALFTAQKAIKEQAAATRAALASNTQVTAKALDFSDNVVQESLGFSGEVVDDAFNQITAINRDAAQLIADANTSAADVADFAIREVAESRKSEDALAFKELIQMGGLIAAAAIVSGVLKK